MSASPNGDEGGDARRSAHSSIGQRPCREVVLARLVTELALVGDRAARGREGSAAVAFFDGSAR
jgi:hypothetical protein